MLAPLKQPATHSVLLRSIISGGRVTRRDSVPAMLTSQALDWPGVLLEAGKNDVAAVDDVVGDRHYLSLNVDTKPLTLEVKGSTGFRAFTIPPLSVWVSPGHDPLTMRLDRDRKSTRLNSSHQIISYAVFCLKKKTHQKQHDRRTTPS